MGPRTKEFKRYPQCENLIFLPSLQFVQDETQLCQLRISLIKRDNEALKTKLLHLENDPKQRRAETMEDEQVLGSVLEHVAQVGKEVKNKKPKQVPNANCACCGIFITCVLCVCILQSKLSTKKSLQGCCY